MDEKEKIIEKLINNYFSEMDGYRKLVATLVSLKNFFETIGANAFVEPKIVKIDTGIAMYPDLLVLDSRSKLGTVFDHKYIKSKKPETIKRELEDIIKYKGEVNIGNSTYKVVECFLLIPLEYFHAIQTPLTRVITEHKMSIAVVSYQFIEELTKIKFTLYNPNNIAFLNEHTRKLFYRTTRIIEVPSQAYYQYKFIRQEPPQYYLLLEIYNLILMGGINPLSEEVSVMYDALLERTKTYYPRWLIADGSKYEQLPRKRLMDAITMLEKIGIVRVKGRYIIAKRPRGKPIHDYLARKLAEYELKMRKPKGQKTLLDFIKS